MAGCLKYSFSIDKLPEKGKSVEVTVEVLSNNENPCIKHRRHDRNARHIAGDERKIMGTKLKVEGPSNYYYSALGKLSKEAFISGNRDHIGNKKVLQKISSEENIAERLHRDVIIECMVARAIYEDEDITSKKIKGYIQYLSLYPFTMHLYSEEQLLILLDHISARCGFLYFDATGTIIGKIPAQDKNVFYYPLVLRSNKQGQPAIPIAEMVSNSHTTAHISNFLFRVQKSLNQLKPGVRPPNKIEIDFSWAMIHGVLLGTNNENITSYLVRHWDIMSDKSRSDKKCVIHICSAHAIHAVARKLHSLTHDKGLIQFLLYVFGLMQNSSELGHLETIFRDLCQLCLSKFQTEQSITSLEELSKRIKDSKAVTEDQDTDQTDEETPEQTMEEDMTALKENPFAVYFRNIRSDIYHELEEPSSQMCNAYYLPEFVDFLLNSYLALAPLWTGLCLTAQTRDTNAYVEGWIKIVKKNILQGKTRLSPGHFVRKMHIGLKGRLREFRETFDEQKKYDKTNIYQAEETWTRKKLPKHGTPKAGKYYTSPKTIPTPKSKTPKRKRPISPKTGIGSKHDKHIRTECNNEPCHGERYTNKTYKFKQITKQFDPGERSTKQTNKDETDLNERTTKKRDTSEKSTKKTNSDEKDPNIRSTKEINQDERPGERSTKKTDPDVRDPSERSINKTNPNVRDPCKRSTKKTNSDERNPSKQSTKKTEPDERDPSERSTKKSEPDKRANERSTKKKDPNVRDPSERSAKKTNSDERNPSERSMKRDERANESSAKEKDPDVRDSSKRSMKKTNPHVRDPRERKY